MLQSFGTNGYFWIGDKFHTDIYGGIFTNSGSIYINYASRDSGFVFTGNSIIIKLDRNGQSYLKFGLNGTLVLPQRSNIFIFDDLLLISATKDSLISLSGYNLDGMLDPSFGINGTSTINFLQNTIQQVDAIFQNNDNLYLSVIARTSKFNQRGILKLNAAGHILDDFGNNGYVTLIDTASTAIVSLYEIVPLEKFIVGIGTGRSPDNYNVFTALIDYNGKFCVDSNSCWQRSFDSLDFQAYTTRGTINLNNELFVMGDFNARFGRPQRTVILKFIIDETVSNNEFADFRFNILPNPVNDYLIVHGNNDSVENSSYYIYNVSGELILNSNFFNTDNKINVSGIPDGMYFLKVYSKELKRHSVHKFIKN